MKNKMQEGEMQKDYEDGFEPMAVREIIDEFEGMRESERQYFGNVYPFLVPLPFQVFSLPLIKEDEIEDHPLGFYYTPIHLWNEEGERDVEEDIFTLYRRAFEVSRGLPFIKRKFFQFVLLKNMQFVPVTLEDACLYFFTNNFDIMAELCGEIIKKGGIIPGYIEPVGEFLVVEGEVWKRILGPEGLKYYEAYKLHMETGVARREKI